MPVPPRSAYAAWVAVCLIWGTTYLAIRVALDSMPPLLMAGMRWSVAGALIVLVMAIRRERIPPLSAWPGLTVLGILLVGFGNGGVVWAEQTVPTGLTAVLVAVIPFWMVGVESLAGDAETISPRRLGGLLVGFAGIVTLVWPKLSFGGGRQFLVGVVATQLACLGWAIGSSLSRRRRGDENVLAASGLQMLFGGVCLAAVGALRGEWSQLTFTTRTTGALVYLVGAGSVAGFSAYGYALKYLPVSTVSLYAYVNPVIAVLLGTFVLGEPLSPRLAVAGAAVLAGMALVREK